MGFGEKAQETFGKAKEGLGDAVNNEDMRRDGQQDRMEANAKEIGEEGNKRVGDAQGGIADKVEDFTDSVRDDRNRR